MVKLNGVPVVPAAVSGLLVMIGVTPAAAMVIVRVALSVPPALFAPSSTLTLPMAVGMPEMLPVVPSMFSPAGSGLPE